MRNESGIPIIPLYDEQPALPGKNRAKPIVIIKIIEKLMINNLLNEK